MHWRTEFETESRYICSCPFLPTKIRDFPRRGTSLLSSGGPVIPRRILGGWREIIPATGYGREWYKTANGCITQLQMQTYLIIRKFERRKNKRGQSCSTAVSYYQKPEELWDCEHVTRAHKEELMLSAERIFTRAR